MNSPPHLPQKPRTTTTKHTITEGGGCRNCHRRRRLLDRTACRNERPVLEIRGRLCCSIQSHPIIIRSELPRAIEIEMDKFECDLCICASFRGSEGRGYTGTRVHPWSFQFNIHTPGEIRKLLSSAFVVTLE